MDSMRWALPLVLALGLGLVGMPQPAAAGACKKIRGAPNQGCITKGDLKKKSVTSGKVKNESLTGEDIKDGSIGAADLAPDAVIGPTYVFLASEFHNGAFGIAAWNAVCQADAAANGLAPGVYRAWLSTGTADARDMLPPGPFVDPLGEFVALSKADLLDGQILREFNRLADGSPITSAVWTGTGQDGRFLAPNCSDWTAGSGSGVDGRTGFSGWTDNRWTSLGVLLCGAAAVVYCFQVR